MSSKLDRKEFLKKACMLSGSVIFSPLLLKIFGCSAGIGLTAEKISPENHLIRYPVKDKLSVAGDAVLLEIDEGGSRIILFRTDKGGFTALNPACTHKGCELVKRKTYFECPCHGSEFDLTGNVIKGPAETPLQSFKTEFANNIVTIFLK